MEAKTCAPVSNLFTNVTKTSNITGSVNTIINLPKIVMVNRFDEVSAKQFYTDMSEAENSDQNIIPIVIDSYGGAVYSLLAMIDCIRSSKKKIATISLSKSMSCGAVLLTCGDEGLRFASPSATILIHDVSSWTYGKVLDLKVDAKETSRLNTKIYGIMNKNTGHKAKYFQNIVQEKGHADWYITPEEAKSHNIVNHVRIPRFNIKLSADVTFE
jgi:ATP-dependent Clp protease protease subunit